MIYLSTNIDDYIALDKKIHMRFFVHNLMKIRLFMVLAA